MRLILLLLIACPLAGQEFWNWFFWEAVDTGKFRVRGVAQIRSQPQNDTFLRAQGGPVLEYQASKRWNLIAGYYFQSFRANFRDPETQGAHRPFGGFEYSFHVKKVYAETRHLYEYFKSLSNPDSARVRSRLRFEFPLPMTPYAQHEIFYDRLGAQAFRTEVGVTYPIAKNLEIDFTYFREIRPERTGGTRDVLNTRITFDGPWKKR